MCIISKVICINKEKEICLPNKEYINGHRYEKQKWLPNVTFMNCSKNVRHLQKSNVTDKQGKLKGS